MGYERIELLFAHRRIVKIDRIPYLVAAGQHAFFVEDQISRCTGDFDGARFPMLVCNNPSLK
jgi:hypothetical protein